MNAIHPVVLSGGSGTRLWPMSRSMYPKQFINFFNGQGRSLLADTLARLPSDSGFSAPIVICNNDHRFLVKEELDRSGTRARAIVLEPIAKNTAPAIAVAALIVAQDDPDGVLVVMPADHVIRDSDGLVESVRKAAAFAAGGRLVLLGCEPTRPHTGYGYIKRGLPLDGDSEQIYSVATFTEKPDLETGKRYLADGGYSWNSGIFVLHAKTFLDELAHFEPAIFAAATGALKNAETDLEFLRLDRTSFTQSPGISIDYAVIERTQKAAVVPVSIGWNDVGSWSSLWEVSPHDDDGNHVRGDTVLEDTHDCYLYAEKAMISTIGVRDLVVVATPDVVLVADKSRTEDVSKIVARLRKSNRKEPEQHLRNVRPWGYFETLALGPRSQVKKLHVKPGGKLSLQMHHHRSEHWVVVQGTARVTIGDTEKLLRENESVYIFATQWHRLENPGKVPLELIEVQIGTHLGEDDIERTDDIYRRAIEETK